MIAFLVDNLLCSFLVHKKIKLTFLIRYLAFLKRNTIKIHMKKRIKGKKIKTNSQHLSEIMDYVSGYIKCKICLQSKKLAKLF
jgi:hypothetical protein